MPPVLAFMKMKELVNISSTSFNAYLASFKGLNENQLKNYNIKKDHSFRVADISLFLAEKLGLNEDQTKAAYLAGLFHDVGRFKQLAEFDTFNDEISVDHAEYSVMVLKNEIKLESLGFGNEEIIYKAIINHNKYKIQDGLTETELLYTRLLRDADKLDIYKVLSDYYINRNSNPNHTLTWNMPKGNAVSAVVAKEILAGKLVSKRNLSTEVDVKVMQLSWVYDINFKPSFEYLLKNRYLEKIYNTLPKNDQVIEIYRKVKVFAENRIL